MKYPRDLPRAELEHIVSELQHAVYFDFAEDRWDRDREVPGGDLVEAACNLLVAYDLAPDRGHDDPGWDDDATA